MKYKQAELVNFMLLGDVLNLLFLGEFRDAITNDALYWNFSLDQDTF